MEKETMEKVRPVDELIAETEKKIIDAINDSHLHMAIVNLILRNVMNQVTDAMHKQILAQEAKEDMNG